MHVKAILLIYLSPHVWPRDKVLQQQEVYGIRSVELTTGGEAVGWCSTMASIST